MNARWSNGLNESRTSDELRHGVTVAHAVSLKNDACREKAGSKKGGALPSLDLALTCRR